MPQVAEDEDAVGLAPGAVIVKAGVAAGAQRADAAAVRFEHEDVDRAGCADRARVGLLLGGGDERADQALVGDGGAVDFLRVGDEVGRVFLLGDGGPAGPAAAPAVDGGQRFARRAAEGGLGFGRRLQVPAERGPRAAPGGRSGCSGRIQRCVSMCRNGRFPSAARATDSSAVNRARASATVFGDCR